MLDNNHKRAVIKIAHAAGQKIMAIYAQDFDIYYKGDSSPLTQADLASHHCILDGLRELTPNIPILSEESSEEEKLNRMSWETYWLIDPLDGTKEFVKKNGEFTVNIGALENALGKEANKEFLPIQPGNVPDTWANVGDLVQQFDYQSNTSVEQDVANFAAWFKDYYEK